MRLLTCCLLIVSSINPAMIAKQNYKVTYYLPYRTSPENDYKIKLARTIALLSTDTWCFIENSMRCAKLLVSFTSVQPLVVTNNTHEPEISCARLDPCLKV